MIPHNKPTLSREEDEAALRVLRSGWVAQGKEVQAFENELCEFIGLPENHAVVVSSGSAALYLALWALEAQQKRIAIPTYSCSALNNAVAMIGGLPSILDTEENYPNLNLADLAAERDYIAIVPHMYGIPVQLPQNSSVRFIEDCAQAIGAKISGKSVGLQGELGVFSFSATKLLTAGGLGGAVVSKDSGLIAAIRDYREFDMRSDKLPRFNFCLGDLNAAIGRVQLRKLPGFLRRRDELFQRYAALGFTMLDKRANEDDCQPVRFRAVICTDRQASILNHLANRDVRAINPLMRCELLDADKPNALALTQKTVSLPMHASLTDAEQDVVINALCEAMA